MRGTLRTKDLWHWQLSAEADERLLIRCRPLISKQPSVSFPGPLSRRLTACFRFNSCQQDDSKIYIYIYIINPIGSTSSAVLFVSYKNCHRGFINLRQKALAQSSHQKWKTCSVCPALGVPRAAETAGNASLTPLLPRGAPAEPPHVLGCTRRH